MIDNVTSGERRELTKGMQFDFVTQRHHLAYQLLVSFAVVTQVMRHHRDFRLALGFAYRRQVRQNRFGCHINAIIDNPATPWTVQTIESISHMLAGGNKLTAQCQHLAE